MAEIIVQYYRDLFSTNNPSADARRLVLDCVLPKVDGQLNEILCGPFSALEVLKALFDMHPDKAPGPDGMSIFFFQKFWDVIEGEVSAAILSVINEGVALMSGIILLSLLFRKSKLL